jgi:23S rRNA pseudouridine1911/1915/1917 synthase
VTGVPKNRPDSPDLPATRSATSERLVTPEEAGTRLDVWLAGRLPNGSRTRARHAISRGKVLLNGTTVDIDEAGLLLRTGDVVRHWDDRPGSGRRRSRAVAARRRDLVVVLDDPAVLVVNKPPGLLVEPLPGEAVPEVTLLDLIEDYLRLDPRRSAQVVHRIDRDTSGLVVFAASERDREQLKRQFENRTPLRVYLALVHGRVTPRQGVWRDRMVWDASRLIQRRAHPREARARDAEAGYTVLEQHEASALLEVRLVTGRRNQIRYQAGVRGHPLVGERLYAFRAGPPPAWPPSPRQALHAWRLAFDHPRTGREVRVEAAPPADFEAVLEAARRGPPR